MRTVCRRARSCLGPVQSVGNVENPVPHALSLVSHTVSESSSIRPLFAPAHRLLHYSTPTQLIWTAHALCSANGMKPNPMRSFLSITTTISQGPYNLR